MQVKDPRLGMVTITDVRVTGDLHDATVFYTVLGDDEERAASAAALESAKGVLRSEVGRQTGVRFTPTLTFVLDALPDNARAASTTCSAIAAAAEDAEVEAARAGRPPGRRGRPVQETAGPRRRRRVSVTAPYGRGGSDS